MNRIYLSMVCVALFLFSACTDFLKEEPRNQLAAEAFFSSLAQVNAAVNNLYREGPTFGYSPGVYNGNNHMEGGWHAGLFDNVNYKAQELFIQWAQLLEMTSSNMDSRMGGLFAGAYTASGRANEILKVLPTVDLVATGISEANKDRIMAEARFFRARNYLWLVRHWGDVPMVTEPQNSSMDLNHPKAPTASIYAQLIIPDLLEAINVLPKTAQHSSDMRITAPVASAHLIDAYVQMAGFPVNDASKWALAATEAKKFLPGGAYATLFTLENNEDFAELSAYNKFRSVNVHTASPGGRRLSRCDEFIYTFEFQGGINNAGFNANAWPLAVGALGSAECAVTLTNNAYKPMPRYLAMYDPDKDLRMKERQYFVNSFDKKNGEILNNELHDTPSPYFFYDWGGVKTANTSGRHFAIYRLAEMYLLAAEAIARSEGVTAQAVDALATIRARAYEYGGVTKAEIVAELEGLSVDAFVEQVWLESYREFVFEFKQWNMITRTRKYPKTNAMDSSIPVGTAQFVDVTTVGTGFSGTKLFTVDHLLWPFPFSQLQRNKNLTQNPGYPES